MRRAVPCLVTGGGLAVGVTGLALWESARGLAAALLVLSLLADCLDGRLARRLGAASRFGAELDWATDTSMTLGFAFRVFPEVAFGLLPLLACFHAWAKWGGERISGRAALTVLALVRFGAGV